MAILKLCTFTEHIINHVRDILVGQRNFPFWKKCLREVFIITIRAHYRVCCQHFKFLRMENNGYWRVPHKLMWGHQLILLQNAVFFSLWPWGPHRVTLVWKKNVGSALPIPLTTKLPCPPQSYLHPSWSWQKIMTLSRSLMVFLVAMCAEDSQFRYGYARAPANGCTRDTKDTSSALRTRLCNLSLTSWHLLGAFVQGATSLPPPSTPTLYTVWCS